MPKIGCGMISFGDSLGVFGGYGLPRGPTEPQSFIKSTDGRGWTNEFHIYHLKEGVFIPALSPGSLLLLSLFCFLFFFDNPSMSLH